MVYILRNDQNKLYIGQTNDLDRRYQEHTSHRGAKFTKDNDAFKLVYIEEFETRADAMKREVQLKKWTRAKKDALIAGDIELLKRL